jgi:hypothetical protein
MIPSCGDSCHAVSLSFWLLAFSYYFAWLLRNERELLRIPQRPRRQHLRNPSNNKPSIFPRFESSRDYLLSSPSADIRHLRACLQLAFFLLCSATSWRIPICRALYLSIRPQLRSRQETQRPSASLSIGAGTFRSYRLNRRPTSRSTDSLAFSNC